jgi:CRISPR/Cas system-associated exonuclease Cas4 (RecB family)
LIMQLSKTDFLHYKACNKSLWLLKHKPEIYPHKPHSSYDDKLAQEGYEVQQNVNSFLLNAHDGREYIFNQKFKTTDGLFAEADIISPNSDGSVNLYEVKSSSSISNEHLLDATFQMITIERGGWSVNKVYIVHVNKEYVKNGDLDVSKMMSFSLVTERVRSLEQDIKVEIDAALKFLTEPEIDETNCSCLKLSRAHHCGSFDYFNPNIPKPSIYNLPRIHKKKLQMFSAEGRFDLLEIDESEVSENQLSVLRAARSNTPVIDEEKIRTFFEQVKYPLYFLDYETYSSAIPIIDGIKPYTHIPFQFSIHVKENKDATEAHHHEYLAESAELPLRMIEKLENIIGTSGNIVAWHKTFENQRNEEFAKAYPKKAKFLLDLVDRTIDLEDVFKGGYVDIAFGGSTSIKKVLPVIVPNLTYEGLTVANGTDAMIAFAEMLTLSPGAKRDKLRNEMLSYCKLDTLAMVRIFETMQEHA